MAVFFLILSPEVSLLQSYSLLTSVFINLADFFCWVTWLSIADGFSFSVFFSSLLPHKQILCHKSCNCTAYHSQKSLPHCYPSIPSTVKTQDVCVTHAINCPFPISSLGCSHRSTFNKMGTLGFVFTKANNYDIAPYSSSMLNDL